MNAQFMSCIQGYIPNKILASTQNPKQTQKQKPDKKISDISN